MNNPTPSPLRSSRRCVFANARATRTAIVAAMLAVMASVVCAQQPLQPPAKDQSSSASAKAQKAPIPAGSQTFNTVITKLKAGKQVFSNTVSEPDLEAAKKACEGQDFIW